MGKKSEYASEYEHILKIDKNCFDAALSFCEGYKEFMNNSKTERECVKTIIKMATDSGYKEFNNTVKTLTAGSKFYVNNRGKSVVLFTIGKESLAEGVNFVISHIDSPRLDLKPNPVYENDEIEPIQDHLKMKYNDPEGI